MKNKKSIKLVAKFIAPLLFMVIVGGYFAPAMANAEDTPPPLDPSLLPDGFFDEGTTPDPDPEPEATDPEPDPTDPEPEPSEDVRIESTRAMPVGFNPLTPNGEAKIYFEFTEDGVVEVLIEDRSGVEIKILSDDEDVTGGDEYYVSWDGTDENGDIVDPSNSANARTQYLYKVIAKDATTLEEMDFETGEINVVYAPIETGEVTTTATTTTADTSGEEPTINLHNSPPTKTSETGPEAFLYLAIPAVGYFIRKRL